MTTTESPGTLRRTLRRIRVLKIALLVGFAVVALRLVKIQVIDAGGYRTIAERQYKVRLDLPAARGNIYDRAGRILVSSAMSVAFAADPHMVGADAAAAAARFAAVFGRPREHYLAKLRDRERRFVYLERHVPLEMARKVSLKGLDGFLQIPETQRIYHYEHVAGQLLGFTDVDNRGLSGVELQFENELRGTNGYVILHRDGRGERMPSVDYPRVEPVNGRNVVLTVDLDLQSIAEEELRKGVERTRSASGLVVMLDPATGEVLAMANYPPLDPNRVSAGDPETMRNRCVTDVFEPGSLFKAVTASAALEFGLVTPERKFSGENGTYFFPVAGGKPQKVTDTHPYGMLTFQEAVEVSSNIVMAKVARMVGAERFYTTARNYGFGTPTGVDLPGETRGELKKPTQWSGTSLQSMAYGYEVGVTPIQVAAAYGALANDGLLLRPYLLKQVLDERHQPVVTTAPEQVRRVVSPQTARTVVRFLEGVVERGTAVAARVPGLRLAGKTGTARKVVDGKYESGAYVASFAGIIPADDPRVVCLVMLDRPAGGVYYGGTASAPIFGAIARKTTATSARFLREPVIAQVGKKRQAVPDVTTLKAEDAEAMLEEQGFDVTRTGSGDVVLRQSPLPGTVIAEGEAVTLTTQEASAALRKGYTVVPRLDGLTARRAVNQLKAIGLDVAVLGSGVVAGQSPNAGQQVKAGTRVTVRCAPRSLASVNLY